MDPAGLYAQTQVELILGGRLSIGDAVPPTQTIYANIDSYPEAVHVSVEALNQLAYKVRKETGRCDLPDIVPAHFSRIAFKQFDEDGNVERDIGSLSFELITATEGAPQVDTELRKSVVAVEPLSFSEQLLESAKSHVFQTNARRAVIDLAGAFEAFAAESLTTRLEANLSENTKQRFLRLYDQQLSESLCAQIQALNQSGDNTQPPPIRRILKSYRQAKVEPQLDGDSLGKVMKVYEYRNDAAHGRPIPSTALHDLIQAIPALEDMRNAFYPADTASN